jgi:hypothetical protein
MIIAGHYGSKTGLAPFSAGLPRDLSASINVDQIGGGIVRQIARTAGIIFGRAA